MFRKKLKLSDLKNIIDEDTEVGLIDKTEKGLPVIDSWGNWVNKELKTLNVRVLKMESCGFLLLVLDI